MGEAERQPININRQVEVRLTDHGRSIVGRYYADLGMKPPSSRQGYAPTTFTLWELAHIFGRHLYMGAIEMPFEQNEIVLLPERAAATA